MSSGKYIISANVTDPYTKKTEIFVQPLTFQATRTSASFQLDKPIYQGGDPMNFRVFCYDSETRPSDRDNGTFTVYDPNNNKIKSFENVPFVKGVFEGSLQLANNAKEGQWRIQSDIRGSVSI